MSQRVRTLVFVLLVPVLVLGLAEVVLRVTGLDPASAPANHLFQGVERDGVRCFQRDPQQNLAWQPAHPFEKPDGRLRIACIGGSTVAGHPYPEAAFYRVLERLLQRTVAPREVEVIGAGVGGMSSDGELAVLRELIDRDLDAVVLYSLHNEFHPGVVQRLLAAQAQPAREGLRSALGSLALGRVLLKGMSGPAQVEASLADRVPNHRPIDGPEYGLVVAHCRENLEAFAALCSERRVPLLLCTVVTNLREFPPLANVFGPDTPDAERARWSGLVDGAAAAAAAGDADTALARLHEAEAIDARPARLAFVRGQALLAAGRDKEARAAFCRARDTDGRINRAVSELNDLVRDFDGRPGVTVVDLEAFFDERAPHGIAGHEAIVDHLHPTVEGQALIAARLLKAFADAHLFTTPEQVAALGLDDPTGAVEGLLDEADLALRGGLEKLQLALEKGRWDETAASAHAALLEALRLSSARAEALAGLGVLEALRGDIETSRDDFQRAASADPEVLRDWRRRAAGSPLVATLLRRADMLEPRGGPAGSGGR